MSGEIEGGTDSQLRTYRRRRRVLDLNQPPVESREDEGIPTRVEPDGVQAGRTQFVPPVAVIDIEALDDDDVIISSPRSFAEAKNNARRSRNRRNVGPDVIDLESGLYDEHFVLPSGTARLVQNGRNMQRRPRVNQNTISINLESGDNALKEKLHWTAPPPPPPPPPPPKELSFTCPICMSSFVEETSTKCGHIFCKACIKMAIKAQSKCPTCRKRLTSKDLIRVFLPAAR